MSPPEARLNSKKLIKYLEIREFFGIILVCMHIL
jgi:hypothetical protein